MVNFLLPIGFAACWLVLRLVLARRAKRFEAGTVLRSRYRHVRWALLDMASHVSLALSITVAVAIVSRLSSASPGDVASAISASLGLPSFLFVLGLPSVALGTALLYVRLTKSHVLTRFMVLRQRLRPTEALRLLQDSMESLRVQLDGMRRHGLKGLHRIHLVRLRVRLHEAELREAKVDFEGRGAHLRLANSQSATALVSWLTGWRRAVAASAATALAVSIAVSFNATWPSPTHDAPLRANGLGDGRAAGRATAASPPSQLPPPVKEATGRRMGGHAARTQVLREQKELQLAAERVDTEWATALPRISDVGSSETDSSTLVSSFFVSAILRSESEREAFRYNALRARLALLGVDFDRGTYSPSAVIDAILERNDRVTEAALGKWPSRTLQPVIPNQASRPAIAISHHRGVWEAHKVVAQWFVLALARGEDPHASIRIALDNAPTMFFADSAFARRHQLDVLSTSQALPDKMRHQSIGERAFPEANYNRFFAGVCSAGYRDPGDCPSTDPPPYYVNPHQPETAIADGSQRRTENGRRPAPESPPDNGSGGTPSDPPPPGRATESPTPPWTRSFAYARLDGHPSNGGVLVGRAPSRARATASVVDLDWHLREPDLIDLTVRGDDDKVVSRTFRRRIVNQALRFAADGRPTVVTIVPMAPPAHVEQIRVFFEGVLKRPAKATPLVKRRVVSAQRQAKAWVRRDATIRALPKIDDAAVAHIVRLLGVTDERQQRTLIEQLAAGNKPLRVRKLLMTQEVRPRLLESAQRQAQEIVDRRKKLELQPQIDLEAAVDLARLLDTDEQQTETLLRRLAAADGPKLLEFMVKAAVAEYWDMWIYVHPVLRDTALGCKFIEVDRLVDQDGHFPQHRHQLDESHVFVSQVRETPYDLGDAVSEPFGAREFPLYFTAYRMPKEWYLLGDLRTRRERLEEYERTTATSEFPDRKSRTDTTSRILASMERSLTEDVGSFTYLQRFFRLAIAGAFGHSFPVTKLIALQNATDGPRERAVTIRRLGRIERRLQSLWQEALGHFSKEFGTDAAGCG